MQHYDKHVSKPATHSQYSYGHYHSAAPAAPAAPVAPTTHAITHAHSHTHHTPDPYAVDPWSNAGTSTTTPDTTGWWSATQQYSPPVIKYVPEHAAKTIYAVCQISETDSIQLAQAPGRAVMARINLGTAPLLLPSGDYRFQVHEYGNSYGNDDLSIDTCSNIGDEYNPLREVNKAGTANPYQDPHRGRLDTVTTDGTGLVTEARQYDFLANLSGHQSIIGRSIAIYDVDAEEAAAAGVTPGTTATAVPPTACCTIGYDVDP